MNRLPATIASLVALVMAGSALGMVCIDGVGGIIKRVVVDVGLVSVVIAVLFVIRSK